MEPNVAEVVARVKAAAAAHQDTYVEVLAADLAVLAAQPGVPPADRVAFAAVAKGAANSPTGAAELHRVKHLAPLLKAVAGE